jgi:hypothetical protein
VKVAFDAIMLTLFFKPSAKLQRQIPQGQRRIEHFIDTLSHEHATIVIPTPALGEFLAYARQDGPAYLAEMTDSEVFEIQPYDQRAAIEAAALFAKAQESGDKRGGAKGDWQTIKIDWQIVAISKVHNVDCVYSDDGDLSTMCATAGLQRKGVADLPEPPPEQMDLPAPPPAKKPGGRSKGP